MFDPLRRKSLQLIASTCLGGCTTTGLRAEAMRTLTDRTPLCAPRANTLLVFLPGVYDTPEDLVREGFVAAVRDRGLPIDMVLVDADVGYYTDESIEHRLRGEVIAPARAAGYRSIWLAGISLGGMGCLAYAEAYGNEVDGLILLAPYLGNRGLHEEIRAAGGLANWQVTSDGADGERRIWRWIASLPTRRDRPVLYLAYGDQDRFAPAHRLLADQLPASQVAVQAGGHDWPVWRQAWASFLDRAETKERFASCAAGGSRQ